MSIAEILGWVSALLTDWGVMPFIQAGLIILTVISAIVYIRRLGAGS